MITSDQLEREGLHSIQHLLKKWENEYFDNSYKGSDTEEPKWIYHTKHTSTSMNPPHASFTTVFSQPTSIRPVPRATASVNFKYSPDQGLVYQFESGKLNYTNALSESLGNPIRKLKDIVKSKEDTADAFIEFQSREATKA
jgi:hypothetical protein